jgi:CRISPR-associated RAMP protein (TIGR02581 family)
MFKRWLCRCDVQMTLTARGPLLVQSGDLSIDGPDCTPVYTVKGGKPTYYLPGTSLKGVVRSHVERIARTLADESVCVPYLERPDDDLPIEADAIGCGHRLQQIHNAWKEANRTLSTPTAYAFSCAACRLFGSTRIAGRLNIPDAHAVPGTAGTEHRDHVAIDRFTGGAAGGLKFDKEVLNGGKFDVSISVENFELWQLGLLCVLLEDFTDGIIAVGSGTSRGLGYVEGEVKKVDLTYLGAQTQVVGVGQLVNDEERDAYGLSVWVPDGAPDGMPTPRRSGLRQIYALGDNWRARLEPLIPGFDHFLNERAWLKNARALSDAEPGEIPVTP